MPGFSIRERLEEESFVRQQNGSSETGRREASVTGDLAHHKTHVFDRPKSVIAKMGAFTGCKISNSINLLQSS